MFGRQVGSGLLRLPVHARLTLRSSPFQCQHDLTSRALLISSQRFFATPARPKKAVGEPSKPVKRAVKRAAKSPSSDSPAKKQVQAKKKAATAKKKAAPKKAVRKRLTEEQKAVVQAKAAKTKVTALKEAALSPPSRAVRSAYNIFFGEKLKGADVKGKAHTRQMGEVVTPIVQEWKNVTFAEQEHYNHVALQKNEAAQAEYKRWVESHTPEQIQLANRARKQLRTKLKTKNSSTKWANIKDERAVKRAATAYIQFSMNRQASGEFKNIPVTERAKLIGQEWKALSESEKKKYKDLQLEDRSRWTSEYNNVYGHMPPSLNNQPQAAAAAS